MANSIRRIINGSKDDTQTVLAIGKHRESLRAAYWGHHDQLHLADDCFQKAQQYEIVLITLGLTLCQPAIAQSKLLKFDPPLKASAGTRQGVDWVNYIYEIRVYSKTGDQRKANYVRRTRRQQDGSTDRNFGHWDANCWESTLNGKLVPARARYGAEYGEPELLNLICNAE